MDGRMDTKTVYPSHIVCGRYYEKKRYSNILAAITEHFGWHQGKNARITIMHDIFIEVTFVSFLRRCLKTQNSGPSCSNSFLRIWQMLRNDKTWDPYIETFNTIHVTRPSDKSVYWKIVFFISHPKHILWVLKRTVSMRPFF